MFLRMQLTLAEPRLLRESINIISDLVNEVTLKIDPPTEVFVLLVVMLLTLGAFVYCFAKSSNDITPTEARIISQANAFPLFLSIVK